MGACGRTGPESATMSQGGRRRPRDTTRRARADPEADVEPARLVAPAVQGHLVAEGALGVAAAVLGAAHICRHVQCAVERFGEPVGRRPLVQQEQTVAVQPAVPFSVPVGHNGRVLLKVGRDAFHLAVRRGRPAQVHVRPEVRHEQDRVFYGRHDLVRHFAASLFLALLWALPRFVNCMVSRQQRRRESREERGERSHKTTQQ
eukprot:scaffold4760_cov113-Isochrysis_galbana.AAC.1